MFYVSINMYISNVLSNIKSPCYLREVFSFLLVKTDRSSKHSEKLNIYKTDKQNYCVIVIKFQKLFYVSPYIYNRLQTNEIFR